MCPFQDVHESRLFNPSINRLVMGDGSLNEWPAVRIRFRESVITGQWICGDLPGRHATGFDSHRNRNK